MIETTEIQCKSLLDLPYQMIMEITKHLPPGSLCTLGRVSKFLKYVSERDEIWRIWNMKSNFRNQNGKKEKEIYVLCFLKERVKQALEEKTYLVNMEQTQFPNETIRVYHSRPVKTELILQGIPKQSELPGFETLEVYP